jgi:DNA polymerase-1
MSNIDLLSMFNSMKFEDPKDMTLNSRVLLVDSLNTFIRSYCAIPSMDENGNNIGGTTGFLRSVGSVARKYNPTRVILVWDGKGGSQRRRKLYPEYKANRKVATRLNRPQDFKTDGDEGENMMEQLAILMKLLEHLPFTSIQIDGVEADDIIGYLARHTQKLGGESIIYSTDKDYLQLVSDKILVFNGQQKKEYNTEAILEKYNVHPTNFLFFRALIGDTSDNINGVPGVKEKTALKHVPELSSGDIEVTYQLLVDKFKDLKKPAVAITSMITEQNTIERNLDLMSLSDQQMSDAARLTSLRLFNQNPPALNKFSLTKEMIGTKILSSFSNYDDWLRSSIMPLTRFYDTD